MNIKVLYEDNHLIAVFKPAGILSQGDKTGDVSIFNEVKKYLKEKYKKPGRVFLGLLHRLDRPVSGIILFAKTSKGASRLSEQFRNHKMEKIYHAIVLGKPEKSEGILINYLKKDQKKLKSIAESDPAIASGKEVSLYYKVIKSNNKYSLLKIKIDTGKFHQIRAQLSLSGFPILGDIKYGHSPLKASEWQGASKSIALCATELFFRVATGEKVIHLKIGLPREWEKFEFRVGNWKNPAL